MSKVSELRQACDSLMTVQQAAEAVNADRAMKEVRALSDAIAENRRVKLRALRDAGWTFQRIADLLGVTPAAVRFSLKDKEGQ